MLTPTLALPLRHRRTPARQYNDQGGTILSRQRTPSFAQTHWEKLLAFGSGFIFVATMLTVALLVPNPTTTQWFVFRVILALAAAGIGSVIPGLIDVHVSTFIRAGGAIALFVIVYYVNPPQFVVSTPPIHQSTSGVNSPAVVSDGNVSIDSRPPAEPRAK